MMNSEVKKQIQLKFSETANEQKINWDFCPSKSPQISIINGEYFFEYDELVFIHALSELGMNQDRMNSDLHYYIHSISGHYNKGSENPRFTIDHCSSDIKRRLSEDFGVSFAALLIHNIYRG